MMRAVGAVPTGLLTGAMNVAGQACNGQGWTPELDYGSEGWGFESSKRAHQSPCQSGG